MSKLLLILKFILILLLISINVISLSIYGVISTWHIIYIFFLILFFFFSFKDLVKKNNLISNNKYNFLSIFVISINLFIYFRVLFDNSFIYNSKYHVDLFLKSNMYLLPEILELKNINELYLNQNFWIFVLMLFLLLIYRKLILRFKNT